MEDYIKKPIMVWIWVYASVCYCYGVAKITPKGTIRLITFIPIIYLFLVLPLNINSFHFGTFTTFFISWLANFKLLLLAFGLGPLSDPSLSLGPFFALSCFPIKFQRNPPPTKPNNPNKSNPHYFIKALILALLVPIYGYRDHIHPKAIRFQLCIQLYLTLELLLATVAFLARALLGRELERQFYEPYYATSLQNYWSRRWNRIVSDILRLSVYQPIRHVSTSILGEKWAFAPSVVVTFFVSGLMHELVLYHAVRMRPTGWTTMFFIMHGVCMVIEITLKKQLGEKWPIRPVVSVPLTLVFVVFTFARICVADGQRSDVFDRMVQEQADVGAFAKDLFKGLSFKVWS